MVIKDSTKWLYYETLVPLFSEHIVLKNFKPVHSGHCADMCGKIEPGAIYFLDDDSGKCRCNFCPIDIIQLFIYPKRLTYFLEYAGCEDIFSLKLTHSVNGIAHC